uniref:Uncharacterized protein n=1 Tax=Hyaloperonospora arabidopsidis (strain Emoy2) TaxID=559515 RepID=M4BVG7_HYAAE
MCFYHVVCENIPVRFIIAITDRVRYYRLAYVIHKYVLSAILISFCVYHTNVPSYYNHLCNPVTNSALRSGPFTHGAFLSCDDKKRHQLRCRTDVTKGTEC